MAEFEHFIPRLGGMHLLLSFIGCAGVLMAESSLLEVKLAAFGGVKHILNGKKFPQNMRALRITMKE